MATDAARTWRAVTLAGERVLECVQGEVSVVFGRGPAQGRAAPMDRAASLLASLRDRARAVRWGEQVHGRLIASLSEEPDQPFTDSGCVGRCDGLMTAEAGVALLVWTADCVPVMLSGGGVVAALHAGWRGAAAGIVPTALRRMELEYGVLAPQLSARLGPAVGPCHYPVGPEVITALASTGVDRRCWGRGEGVDLRAFVSAQLVRHGLAEDRVETVGGCTACDPQMASYRRDGKRAGRQFSLIFRAEPCQPP